MEPYTCFKTTSTCHEKTSNISLTSLFHTQPWLASLTQPWLTSLTHIYFQRFSQVLESYPEKSFLKHFWWLCRHLITLKTTAQRQTWINDLEKHERWEHSRKTIPGTELIANLLYLKQNWYDWSCSCHLLGRRTDILKALRYHDFPSINEY